MARVWIDKQYLSQLVSLGTVNRTAQLIYFAGSLGPGDHSVTIEMQSETNYYDPVNLEQEALTIDYMDVYTTPLLEAR